MAISSLSLSEVLSSSCSMWGKRDERATNELASMQVNDEPKTARLRKKLIRRPKVIGRCDRGCSECSIGLTVTIDF